MEHVFLGSTGVRVSRLAFGTMSFGDGDGERVAATMFDLCRTAGINLFDCADVYHQGQAERILGRLIGGCRDDVVISTKAYFPTGPGPNDRGSSRYHLRRAVEASLRRLATDRIDLFFLHRMDDQTPLEESLREVERLVQEGKILYPAVSNFAAWQTARAVGVAERHGWAPVACAQPMYNLLKRQAESEILPMCAAERLGCITYGPLGGGLLSGKYGVDDRPSTGRIVDNAMYRTRYAAPSNFEIAERFVALAREHGHHPAALAIAWVAAHPAVTAPLLGARTPEQLQTCLGADAIDMSDALYAEIAALSPSPAPATDRNEESSTHNYGSR
ncbi:MAG: aldo/keto reductase [Deltaproteobacteria bacterium]|nr:aldo/keto reductase [Deltaproteobacteria bacterium]